LRLLIIGDNLLVMSETVELPVGLSKEEEQQKFTTIVHQINRLKSGESLSQQDKNLVSKNIRENFSVLEERLVRSEYFLGAVAMLTEVKNIDFDPQLAGMAKTAEDKFVDGYRDKMKLDPKTLDKPDMDLSRISFALERMLGRVHDRDLAQSIILEKMKGWGVESGKILEAWGHSVKKEGASTPFAGITENLPTCLEIESKRPGIMATLSKEFGIMDFGRYPAEMLVAQYDQREDHSRPYGVIIYPRDDWNGAFMDNVNSFKGLYEQLDGKANVRIVEAQGKISIARRLLALRNKYPERKISFAVIGGHGEKDHIQFGNSLPEGDLYASDLYGRGVQRTSEFFVPNPTIVLASCSTGTEGGIGQKLSEIMGAKVIAPEKPVKTSKFDAKLGQDGSIQLDVKYSESGTERTYMGGVSVP
jgi:hypothetical protein